VNANGEIKAANAGFAIRCRPHLRFRYKRLTNAQYTRVIDSPCYHYGYVMSDDEMHEKISTWSHAKDFNAEKWFRLKWLNWSEATRNLHPTNPVAWKKAIRFPLEQPEFAEEFALPINVRATRSLDDVLQDRIYDSKALLHDLARKIVSSVRAGFHKD
jgi:hypothetical protein